jgi:heme/copper-type cytochrome/quinol oxidase subunit 3
MEIPYTFTARKDTGLFNSKIGIWLFLASEVMLFGGLFSGYVFLRIYADYPWPERALPVLPGLINTFVLIGSSVTVVFAWASLKMRQWRRFQFFMGITIACAVIFMILKGMEYNAKWHHQAVRMDDFTILEGHTHKATLDDHGHLHGIHHGDEVPGGAFPQNVVVVETEEINLTLVRAHDPYVEDILEKAIARGATPVLKDDAFFYGAPKDMRFGATAKDIDPAERAEGEEKLRKAHSSGNHTAVKFGKKSLFIPKGTPLTTKLLGQAEEVFLDARSNNGRVRTDALRREWKRVRSEFPDEKRDYKLAKEIKITPELLTGRVAEAPSALTFAFKEPVALHFKRSVIREGDGTSRLKDDTILKGKVASSPLGLAVDAVDLRWVAQRAEEQGKDPDAVIAKLWIMENPGFKEIWERHSAQLASLEEHLTEKYGLDEHGNPKRVPTENDRYRIDWQDLVAFHRAHEKHLDADSPEVEDLRPGMMEGITGPDHKNEEFAHAFFSIEIPNEKVAFESLFTPKWNNYYAIYFTITGLHGLHVIGGALVLSYFLFFSKGLYRSNPEWLANRVEIGGLFWHFVDLVWIFLFPILYLM